MLRWRLSLPLRPSLPTLQCCSSCSEVEDIIGDHRLCCIKGSHVSRHDGAIYVFARSVASSGTRVEKEVAVDGRECPADLLADSLVQPSAMKAGDEYRFNRSCIGAFRTTSLFVIKLLISPSWLPQRVLTACGNIVPPGTISQSITYYNEHIKPKSVLALLKKHLPSSIGRRTPCGPCCTF